MPNGIIMQGASALVLPARPNKKENQRKNCSRTDLLLRYLLRVVSACGGANAPVQSGQQSSSHDEK